LSSSSSSSSSAPSGTGGRAPPPFRGPAADSRLGELLLDVLPLACAVGHALDLHHARWLCGTTLREGARRADGSLDRAGFLGGTADMIRSAARLQGLDAMRAEGREMLPATQLTRAAYAGDEKRVRALVAAGAKLDLVDSGGWSALHYASYSGHVRMVKLLLDGKYEVKGAGINLQRGGGETPLILASMYGREAVVRLLLERGADVTLRTRGSTALYYARTRNHAAIVALLEAHGAPE
jgi:hypothetical protein